MQMTEFVTATYLLKRLAPCDYRRIPSHPGAANP